MWALGDIQNVQYCLPDKVGDQITLPQYGWLFAGTLGWHYATRYVYFELRTAVQWYNMPYGGNLATANQG